MYASQFKPNLFENKVILITGGGSGMGRCCALELISLQATVVIAGRKEAKLIRVIEQVKQYHPTAKISHLVMNIRQSESVQKGIQEILGQYGRLDGVVNNAGGQYVSPAEMITDKGWQAVLDTNLTGTWNVCKAAFEEWMRDHGGVIVNIVSEMWNGFPMMAHSAAARAGVVNLTKTLAIEWGQYGVRINSIAPGTILGNGMNNYPDQVLEKAFEQVAWQASNPSGRMGLESEVASTIVFLLSPGASYIHGTTLRVDGGSSLAKGGYQDFFSKDARLNLYNGLDPKLNNELSPKLQQLLAEYEKRQSKL